jgi:hypothetical protein
MIRRILIALAAGALVVLIAGMLVIAYLYVSLTPNSTAIVKEAQANVPATVSPPAPQPSAQTTTETKRICFNVPVVMAVAITTTKFCTDIAARQVEKFVQPSDDEKRQWNQKINDRRATPKPCATESGGTSFPSRQISNDLCRSSTKRLRG